MLRHVALFRWKESATKEDIEAVGARLAELPGIIAELVNYNFGPDLGLSSENWDFAVSADVLDEKDLAAYIQHPAHKSVVSEAIVPIRSDRSSVQFEI